MAFGIDWAAGRPSTRSLKGAGVKFVCRYLAIGKTWRTDLTRDEAQSYVKAGIDLVVVWETTAGRALGGFNAGKQDAQRADYQAKVCGQPSGRPIFFAVDFDAKPSDQDELNAYFKGVASVIGKKRTGAYGGYWVIKRLFDAGLISYGWQTYAWSGGLWDPRAKLQQYSNGRTLVGVSCDYNRSTAEDFGQWVVPKARISKARAKRYATIVRWLKHVQKYHPKARTVAGARKLYERALKRR